MTYMQVPGGAPPDPDYDEEALSGLSNEDLLLKVQEGLQRILVVTDAKQVGVVDPRINLNLYVNWALAWNTAIKRGYSYDELASAVIEVCDVKGLWRDLHQAMGEPENWTPRGSTTWRDFEKLVAELHRKLGQDYEVAEDEKCTDRTTGKLRQVDVTLRSKTGPYELLTVIECREHARPLDVTAVDGFITKLADLKANKGVFVSSNGFTKSARSKAAHHGIETYTLREALDLDWATVHKHRTRAVPIPTEIKFTPLVTLEAPPIDPGSFPMKSIYLVGDGEPVQLISILADVGAKLDKARVPLPCSVSVLFEPSLSLHAPTADYTPAVTAMDVVFEHAQVRQTRQISVPKATRRYRYRNEQSGEEMLVSLDLGEKDG